MLIHVKFAEGKTEVPKSVQLLKVGEFLQENGKKIAITADLLRSFKKNFDAKVRGYEDGRLPVDYFHENESHAAGWIGGLELRDGDTALWAEVDWTPKASQMLADGEIRYISAEFHFNYRHNEGGKTFGPTLFGAGLTNRPFIKGMQAVVNLSEGDGKMDLEQALARIKELEAQLAAMKGEKAASETQLGDMKKQLSELQEKYDSEKKLAEKNTQFTKMLAEGKACEAQREAFISGDMVKFAENAKPLNTSARGSEGNPAGTGGGSETVKAVDEVEKLAEGIRKDRKVSYRESVSLALSENPELAKKYEKETAIA